MIRKPEPRAGLRRDANRLALRVWRQLGWRGWGPDAGAQLRRLLENAYVGDTRKWEVFLEDSLPFTARWARDVFKGTVPSDRTGLASRLDRLRPGWERQYRTLALALGRSRGISMRWIVAVAAALVAMLAVAVVALQPSMPAPHIRCPKGTNEARDEKILHAWDPVRGAIFYELQFINQPPHTAGVNGDQIRTILGTTVYFDHQDRHCPIGWRVRAVDSKGDRSNWAYAEYRVDCQS